MTQVQVGNEGNVAQAQAWWRSTFVRGLAAAELVDFMDGAAARTPRGCALQVEQVGGAMRSPHEAHTATLAGASKANT